MDYISYTLFRVNTWRVLLAFLLGMPFHLSAQQVYFTGEQNWVNLGDVDIPGDQITVEALVFLYGPRSHNNVVSKHISPANVNYLLRTSTFEITTYLNGNSGPTQFLQMNNPYSLRDSTWYHIAGTYDGQSVKYYVNGCLVIEEPFSGNLYQNNFLTAIGNQSNCQCESYSGGLDEVRIWNVCRTQDEIESNMTNLDSPQNYPGLIAYYKFDNNFINSQGNSGLNGSLIGQIEFLPGEINIEPFQFTDLQIQNVGCGPTDASVIELSTNDPDARYSFNNMGFQDESTFLSDTGLAYVEAISLAGCRIDTTIQINGLDTVISTELEVSVCDGENYLGYSEPGEYLDTTTALNGCDSISIINLNILPTYESNERITICEGGSYQGFTETGLYVDTLTAANGCDSIYYLDLEVNATSFTELDVNICQGETYLGFNESGMYLDTFLTVDGCDSIRALSLNVNPTYTKNIFTTVCDNIQYYFGGEEITEAGTYVSTLISSAGCDSIVYNEVSFFSENFLGEDTIICSNQPLRITSPLPNTEWNDGVIGSHIDINTTGDYSALILNVIDGCKNMDTISVAFYTDKIYVPNVFSPNSDGVNDLFFPAYGQENSFDYKMEIYDRWGGLQFVKPFEVEIPGWDGVGIGQKEAAPGIYVYKIITDREECGLDMKVGDVLLSR
ncbi:LamG-like jellyroll fold domain-containing protein [Phaeodactylibacter xiamenensis]|uniref:LamG-like jellyroll fold domain-containing protein n=1 Tax=Phaeodactylibacter xiamenensis TaxID=1524460 RepID=UPI003CCB9E65